jgi:hypothetical protein
MLLMNQNDTPLYKATENGHTEVARHLCSGADATLAGRYLFTPLHWAAKKGIPILLNFFWKKEQIQMLLINQTTHHFMTLLKTDIRRQHGIFFAAVLMPHWPADICTHHFTGLQRKGILILLNFCWKKEQIQMLLIYQTTHLFIRLPKTDIRR